MSGCSQTEPEEVIYIFRMLKHSPEETLLKLSISNVMADQEQKIKNLLSLYPIDWQRFKCLVLSHDLAGLVYFSLKNHILSLPENLREFFKKSYYSELFRSQYYWKEFLRISTAFKQAGVMFVPIKGVALYADLYHQIPFRPMSDIDLLVKELNKELKEFVWDSIKRNYDGSQVGFIQRLLEKHARKEAELSREIWALVVLGEWRNNLKKAGSLVGVS